MRERGREGEPMTVYGRKCVSKPKTLSSKCERQWKTRERQLAAELKSFTLAQKWL